MRTTLDALFAAACERIERLDPAAAHAELEDGALVIDIRDGDVRRRTGVVPGSLHVPRTVLEWRVDPGGPWRNAQIGGLNTRLIVLCDHGCSSALAAATLVDLGFERAADVVGGFEAWQAAGLPVVAPRDPVAGELPGGGPPD